MKSDSLNMPSLKPEPKEGAIPMRNVTDILGVNVSAINMGMAIETIGDWIDHDEKHYVAVCNVHLIVEANRDGEIRDILNGAGLCTPDGMPLVWLQRRAGKKHATRVAGPDLMLKLCARSASTGYRHFFYGGAPGVAELLVEKLSDRFPDMYVAGNYTPPMMPVGAIESDNVIDTINASKADIVWVGLGAPKQEWWVKNHQQLLNAPVLIAVGAAFDFNSGRIRRAPYWMQRIGLEWLYRMSQDPGRLWKRYLMSNIQFMLKLARAAISTH